MKATEPRRVAGDVYLSKLLKQRKSEIRTHLMALLGKRCPLLKKKKKQHHFFLNYVCRELHFPHGLNTGTSRSKRHWFPLYKMNQGNGNVDNVSEF